MSFRSIRWDEGSEYEKGTGGRSLTPIGLEGSERPENIQTPQSCCGASWTAGKVAVWGPLDAQTRWPKVEKAQAAA